MSYKFVYLLTRLDAVNTYIEGMSVISIIAISIIGLVIIICFAAEEMNIYPKVKKFLFAFIIMLFVSSSLQIIVPTTKEAAVIYLLPKMANNEDVQKIPQNAFKLLNTQMEKWLKEQTGEKNN